MTDYQIPASAVEAAAKAIHGREWVDHGYGPWEKFVDKDRLLSVGKAALRAAFEELGMHRMMRGDGSGQFRYESRWMPVEEP